MGTELPFPFEIVLLVLVLPIALVWLTSVASVAMFAVRKGVRKLLSRLRPQHPASPGG